jgi:dTMP kinase
MRTLALLYAADRRDHTVTDIDPSLAIGSHVISDRYLLSSLAYQGLDLDIEWLLEINASARVPDLTIFLDLPVEQAMLRMKAARWTRDLFEEEEKLRRVVGMYREMVASDIGALGPIIRVDATRPRDEVTRRVRAIVAEFLDQGVYDKDQINLTLFPPSEMRAFPGSGEMSNTFSGQ